MHKIQNTKYNEFLCEFGENGDETQDRNVVVVLNLDGTKSSVD